MSIPSKMSSVSRAVFSVFLLSQAGLLTAIADEGMPSETFSESVAAIVDPSDEEVVASDTPSSSQYSQGFGCWSSPEAVGQIRKERFHLHFG